MESLNELLSDVLAKRSELMRAIEDKCDADSRWKECTLTWWDTLWLFKAW